MVVKTRDTIFCDHVCPYDCPITRPPTQPLPVEIDWPQPVTSAPEETPRLPITHIFRLDRWLQALAHNPENALPAHLIPLPRGNNTDLAAPPLPPSTTPLVAPPTGSVFPRWSARPRRPPVLYGAQTKSTSTSDEIDTPKTWKQVLRSPDRDLWVKAADAEFASLLGMKTWKLVPRPAKQKIIKSKWVFKPKRRPDGSILKLKARLVAMGFTQTKGVDFDEVFAPTTRAETLCLLCSLLGSKKWAGYQIDFKTTFLNRSLKHLIYVAQAPGYEDPDRPDNVYEMVGSIYGLKQSPRQWNKVLHALLISLGLVQSQFDPTLYFKVHGKQLVCAIAAHVDDLVIIGENSFIQPLMDQLEKTYKVGQCEPLHHFLSLKITCDVEQQYVYLSQEHYISDLQKEFFPGSLFSAKTPTASNFKDLGPRTESDAPSPGPYSSLIGAQLWVAQST